MNSENRLILKGQFLHEAPSCWQNFVKSLRIGPYGEVGMRRINDELKAYHATFKSIDEKDMFWTVDFKKKEDLIFFLLKWS